MGEPWWEAELWSPRERAARRVARVREAFGDEVEEVCCLCGADAPMHPGAFVGEGWLVAGCGHPQGPPAGPPYRTPTPVPCDCGRRRAVCPADHRDVRRIQRPAGPLDPPF